MKADTFKFRLSAPLLLALATAGLAGCSQDAGEPGTTNEEHVDSTLATVIKGTEGLATIASALDQTGLSSVFGGPGSYTILAPDDAAFKSLGDKGEALQGEEQRALLVALLRNHIVPGHLTPDAIKQAIKGAGGSVKMRTLGEGSVTFEADGDSLSVTGPRGAKAKLSGAAVEASNGVIIPLDALIDQPPEDQ